MSALPPDLLPWLNDQLAKAEKNLRAREQMADRSLIGTDAEWREIAAMVGGPFRTKKERTKECEQQGRIAEWCRRDVENFKAVIAALTPATH
jgi:hypothetical protein